MTVTTTLFGVELWMYGWASGGLSLIAFAPYIRDTLNGTTRPERASWLIWSMLGTIAFFSQLFEGATASLWFAGSQVSGTVVIFLLSIKRGTGAFLSWKYTMYFLIAASGLVIWYYSKSAAYALVITISISFLGCGLTVQKAYDDPKSETISTWAIAMVSSLLAALSVGQLNWVLLAYPLYLLALSGAIIGALLLARLHSSVDLRNHVLQPAPIVQAPEQGTQAKATRAST